MRNNVFGHMDQVDEREMTFAQSNFEQIDDSAEMNVISIHRSVLFEMM